MTIDCILVLRLFKQSFILEPISTSVPAEGLVLNVNVVEIPFSFNKTVSFSLGKNVRILETIALVSGGACF